VASAVQRALEASPVLIDGRQIAVEKKRSTNQGNTRGRFRSGRVPDSRGDGAIGHGNYRNSRNYARIGEYMKQLEN